MKKILFATTALVASAGVASAQDLGVNLTGNAEMGIYDNGNDDSQFFTDLDVTFTMSGVADNGLTFGAFIDLDEAADRTNPGRFESPGVQGGENIFVSFGGATLTMGDTDGAYDARLAEMALAGGSLNDDETGHAGFDDQDGFFSNTNVSGLDGTADGQIARFDYTVNTLSFSVSIEQGDNGVGAVEDIYAVGASYDAEMGGINLGLGIGFQDQKDVASSTGLSLTGGMANGFSAGLLLTKTDFDARGADDQNHVGIGFGYEMNAIAVGVNFGKFNNYRGVDGDEARGYGLAASYDLGGGLSARLGYGYSETDIGGVNADADTYSAGLQMRF